jgi:hypothetical protein
MAAIRIKIQKMKLALASAGKKTREILSLLSRAILSISNQLDCDHTQMARFTMDLWAHINPRLHFNLSISCMVVMM